jgi:hypothetical protein
VAIGCAHRVAHAVLATGKCRIESRPPHSAVVTGEHRRDDRPVWPDSDDPTSWISHLECERQDHLAKWKINS